MTEIFDDFQKASFARQTKDASTLTLEKLFDAKKLLDRYDKVYLIATKALPDDCYGIMYVRPEDIPKVPK